MTFFALASLATFVAVQAPETNRPDLVARAEQAILVSVRDEYKEFVRGQLRGLATRLAQSEAGLLSFEGGLYFSWSETERRLVSFSIVRNLDLDPKPRRPWPSDVELRGAAIKSARFHIPETFDLVVLPGRGPGGMFGRSCEFFIQPIYRGYPVEGGSISLTLEAFTGATLEMNQPRGLPQVRPEVAPPISPAREAKLRDLAMKAYLDFGPLQDAVIYEKGLVLEAAPTAKTRDAALVYRLESYGMGKVLTLRVAAATMKPLPAEIFEVAMEVGLRTSVPEKLALERFRWRLGEGSILPIEVADRPGASSGWVLLTSQVGQSQLLQVDVKNKLLFREDAGIVRSFRVTPAEWREVLKRRR